MRADEAIDTPLSFDDASVLRQYVSRARLLSGSRLLRQRPRAPLRDECLCMTF